MRLTIDNYSMTHAQTGWATVPLPVHVEGGEYRWNGWRAYVRDQVAYVHASMAPGQRGNGELRRTDATTPDFTLSPNVGDDVLALIPRFVLDIDGVQTEAVVTAPQLIEANPVRMVFKLTALIPQAPLTIVMFAYVFTNQATVEFEIRATYGNTNPGQPRDRVFGELRMIVGEFMHIDYRTRKGLPFATWVDGKWEQVLVVPREWMRARTIEVTGAFLCLNSKAAHFDPEEQGYGNLVARLEGPLLGIAEGWEGHWLGTGAIPGGPWLSWSKEWASRATARSWQAWRDLAGQPGDEFDPRPLAQPPASGTTGSQADFGATRGEWAVSMMDPATLYPLRWNVQAWNLRPYANREPDGSRCTKEKHLECISYNLYPYDRLSRDMLGWPKPTGWISGYTTSDSQHRSDNLLYAMWNLTRSYSIRETILDIIANQEMELDRGMPIIGSGVGSPRGWGRPLTALCHAYAAGFTQVRPLIVRQVEKMWQAASFRIRPETAAVRVLSNDEAKYGWTDPAGKLIQAWLPWQESIAVMGLWAAWKQLGIPEALEMCKIVAATIARFAFYEHQGEFRHCYAIRYDPEKPGEAPAAEHFAPPVNQYVYTDGACASWTMAALYVLLQADPQNPASAYAQRVIDATGEPMNWDNACWWSL